MAQIDFGDTEEQQLATLMVIVTRLYLEWNGNGQEGFRARTERFMSEHNGAQAEQIRQHESNSRKLNIIMALCAIFTLAVLVIGTAASIELSRRSNLDPANIFHSSAPVRVYAKTNDSQHATSPQLGR